MNKSRREYYKKWREKNRESIREKDKIRHTKKVLKNEGRLPTQILRELSDRVPTGLPDWRNPHHVDILRQILINNGWDAEAIRKFVNELLLPIRVGEKKYLHILKEREEKKDEEFLDKLSEFLDENVDDNLDIDTLNESKWKVESEDGNMKWKYCPHCGETLQYPIVPYQGDKE